MHKILALICLGFSLAGQKTQIVTPEPDEDGGGYSLTQPNFTYRGEYPPSRKLDFGNFVLHTFDGKNQHALCGKLHGGLWEETDKDHVGMESLTWQNAYSLSSENPSIRYVLAFFTYFGVGGSSESDGYAQVWRWQGGKLTIIQQIQFNTHFAGDREYFAFDKDRQSLIVRASHYMLGDAHCCISAFDEMTFRWEDGLFKLQKKATKPNHPSSAR